jgi:hypothetical protein
MSTVTQRIPNLFLGISQQPDTRKFPGQVRDSINAYPDYALGLLKRPGGKFISSLINANSGGRWFSILRDDQEKYVGQYADNIFRIWSLIDGSPRRVNMGSNTGVPGGCNQTNLQSALADYNTARSLTATRLTELNNAQSAYAEALEGQNPTITALFQVNYNYPNGDIEQYLSSGILRNAAGVHTVKNNNTVVSVSASLPAGYALGTELTDEHPLLASQGYRVYQAALTVAATHTSGQLATASSAMSTAQTNYNNAVSDEATKRSTYNTQLSNCAVTTVPSNAYLKDATPADLEFLTLNDYTFVLNKKKVVAMKAATTAALPYQAMVVITIVAYNTKYQVVLNGTTYSYTTPQDASSGVADTQTITSSLASSINGVSGFTAVAVGPGIYISRSTSFTIETRGSTQEDGIFAFQDQVGTINRLPTQSKNGYKVQITNTQDIDVDDMWVEFKTTDSQSYGPGVWEETSAPGITYELDELTLPHQLVRQSDGSFTYGPVSWEDRLVGDDQTNPLPSFVGSTISGIFFYRNRLGFLSDEAVVLSKAGDYFNFFAGTALTVSDDDPIDITASSTRPVSLNYVLQSSVGLVLYGQNDQFLLTTDSDILSPKTAKINTLSTYECEAGVKAVPLGTTQAFISKTPLYTRVFELFEISNDRPPFMYEQSKPVPELIPSTADSLISSPGLSIVSLGTKGSSMLYQYKFLQDGEKRPAQSWYKWQLTGNLLDQFFDASTFYTVVTDGSKVQVLSYDLTQANEEGYLTLPTGEKTDVCLDWFDTNPYRTYTSGTDTTRVYLPFDHPAGKTFTVMALGGFIGGSNALSSQSVGAVLYPTVQGSAGAYYVDIDGDYRGRDLIVGYLFNMEVELPKFYLSKLDTDTASADYTADLVIHRLKVSTGLSGPVTYQINITGIPSWSSVTNVTLPNSYTLNNVNMQAASTHVVPLYQRNENLGITIVGDTPFPVSILGLTWEGRYNNRFYKRV